MGDCAGVIADVKAGWTSVLPFCFKVSYSPLLTNLPYAIIFKPCFFKSLRKKEHRLGCDFVMQYGFMIHSFSQNLFLQSRSWVGILSPAKIHRAEWKEYKCFTGARLQLRQWLSLP